MCVSLQNIWCSPVRKTSPEYLKTRHYSRIFLTFSDMRIPSFPVVFESANWSTRSIIQQFSFTVNSTKAIVFVVLRMRCQMGKRFVFVAYWCFPVTEDCFHRSFPSRTERFLPLSKDRKMPRKRLKTTCRPTFTGGQRKEMPCFLAFFSCLR